MANKETALAEQGPVAKKWYVSVFALASLFGLAGGVWGASIFAARGYSLSKVQATSEIVVPASGLLFKSADGKTIAKLISVNPGSSFQIFDPDGQKVAELQSFRGGGSLTLWNDESVLALEMTGDTAGGSFRLMDTKKGKNVVQIYPGEDGGTIIVNDGHGDSVVKLGVDRKGGKVETFLSESR